MYMYVGVFRGILRYIAGRGTRPEVSITCLELVALLCISYMAAGRNCNTIC